jgi:hypothetical protein
VARSQVENLIESPEGQRSRNRIVLVRKFFEAVKLNPRDRVAAIISVVETCRCLKIPVRDYLGSVLSGLGDFPVGRIGELTPAAWATRD